MPKIKLAYPVMQLTGKFTGSDVVYYTAKNGNTIARAGTKPANPRSPGQTTMRACFAAASKAWATITASQRQDWTDYAAEYFKTAHDGSPLPPNGMNAFVRANITRQVLGLSIVNSAPLEAPPPPLSGAVAAGGEGADSLPVDITHSISTITGLQVIVQMTKAMVTVARKPQENQLRLCCGVTAASALPLTASGTTLLFTPTIYSVQDGQRFGIDARVVRTADGIVSMPVFNDAIKSI